MKHPRFFQTSLMILAASLLCNAGAVFASSDWGKLTTNKSNSLPALNIKAVTGEVQSMGEYVVVVKDAVGTETPLRIDRFTAMIGDIQYGDMVEAHISTDGWLISVRRLDGFFK